MTAGGRNACIEEHEELEVEDMDLLEGEASAFQIDSRRVRSFGPSDCQRC